MSISAVGGATATTTTSALMTELAIKRAQDAQDAREQLNAQELQDAQNARAMRRAQDAQDLREAQAADRARNEARLSDLMSPDLQTGPIRNMSLTTGTLVDTYL